MKAITTPRHRPMREIASRLIWLIVGMSLGGFVLDGQQEVRIALEAVLGAVVAVLWVVDREIAPSREQSPR